MDTIAEERYRAHLSHRHALRAAAFNNAKEALKRYPLPPELSYDSLSDDATIAIAALLVTFGGGSGPMSAKRLKDEFHLIFDAHGSAALKELRRKGFATRRMGEGAWEHTPTWEVG